MIEEDYVSFDTAKLLKEKGFDETCRAFWKDWNSELRICSCCSSHVFEWCHNSMLEKYYNDDEETNIAAPTLQMAIKWLREIHDIYIMIDKDFATENGWHYVIITKQDWNNNIDNGLIQQESNNYTYEFACEAAIKYCLENLV